MITRVGIITLSWNSLGQLLTMMMMMILMILDIRISWFVQECTETKNEENMIIAMKKKCITVSLILVILDSSQNTDK